MVPDLVRLSSSVLPGELPLGWPTRLRPDRLAALAFQTPYVAGDVTVIADRFTEFRTVQPGIEPYYSAVKASPAPEVISTLAGLGAGFRAGSFSELKLLMGEGVEGARVLFGNAVAPGPQLRSAVAAGVWRIAFESRTQLFRIAEYAPGASVYLNLRMDADGLRPLGADPSEARTLMIQARDHGLVPYGLSLPTGASSPALARVGEVMAELLEDDIGLGMLNLGSGLPVAWEPAIRDELLPYRPDNLIWEPGPRLVEDSAVLVTTVLDRSQHAGQTWLVLDAGLHQGLTDAGDRPLATSVPDHAATPTARFSLAGPSSDPADVIACDVYLPDALAPGDLVMFGACGAHLSSATGPRTLFV